MLEYIILLIFLIMPAIIIILIIFDIASKLKRNRKLFQKLEKYNVKIDGKNVYLNYRNYDIIISLRTSDFSIVHNKDVKGITRKYSFFCFGPLKNKIKDSKINNSFKISPLYITFRIKNTDEMDKYLNDFINLAEDL